MMPTLDKDQKNLETALSEYRDGLGGRMLFYDHGRAWRTLGKCLCANHEPIYMSELSEILVDSPLDSRIWSNSLTSMSLVVVGKTEQGTEVVAFVHTPHYLSNPGTMQDVGYKGIIPVREFKKILSLEDSNNVFVVDWKNLEDSLFAYFGNQDKAQRYAQHCAKLFGEKLEFDISELEDGKKDLDLKKQPFGRLFLIDHEELGFDALHFNFGYLLGKPKGKVEDKEIIQTIEFFETEPTGG